MSILRPFCASSPCKNNFCYDNISFYTRVADIVRYNEIQYLCHLLYFRCAGASQRVEKLVLRLLADSFPEAKWLEIIVLNWDKHERGSLPSPMECIIIIWVLALMWKEMKIVYDVGIMGYLCDLWNLADCFTNMCFTGWIMLRMTAYVLVQREEAAGRDSSIPREEWHAYDPYLISEGLFGAGMISSYLKLVHIFSINPQLGPLQISLGRMTEDIFKFGVLYCLVLFAFGCGMNQLLWYYADLEYYKCYGDNDEPDPKYANTACIVWRRFANMFETAQSLFWASFGLVPLTDFELTGIKEFTRFWALLMFGSYSVCNIIVLLNMLIAMMSNSYQSIAEQADVEWKFARTKLWISYFDNGATVPPPFNIFPTPKTFMRLCGCNKKTKREEEIENKKDKQHREISTKRYNDVMKCIIRRYITAEQKKTEDFNITEDDVSEIRQDINKFRYEMIEILKNNNFVTPNTHNDSMFKNNKRAKQKERRILKGFNLTTSDVIKEAFSTQQSKPQDFFAVIAKAIGKKSPAFGQKTKGEAGDSLENSKFEFKKFDHKRNLGSFKEKLSKKADEDLTNDELLQYNPNLARVTPTTRFAYAKFKTKLERKKSQRVAEQGTKQENEEGDGTKGKNNENKDKQKGGVSGSSTALTIIEDEEKLDEKISKSNESDIDVFSDSRRCSKDIKNEGGKYSGPRVPKNDQKETKGSLNCLISAQGDDSVFISKSVTDTNASMIGDSYLPTNGRNNLFDCTKSDSSTLHQINSTMPPLSNIKEKEKCSDKRQTEGKSPSPPLVPPRGVVRNSSSSVWDLQGSSNAYKNRPLSEDSIPYADIMSRSISSEEGRCLKESGVHNPTNGRDVATILTDKDNTRNMIVHNRSGQENHSSLENISVDASNGSNQGRPVATIVPHSCLGGCDAVVKGGQRKTGWL